MIAKNILELIGKTPLVEINNVSEGSLARIIGKCEFSNPAGSVKDRPGLAMIEQAEKEGLIDKDTVIIEPTSGNTGIALALVAAVKGYEVILIMPESMSIERRSLLTAFGAKVELTPAHLGMKGAIDRAYELKTELGKAYIPQQFTNKNNPNIHYLTTGPEIWEATEGKIDILVSAVGTGGSISGTSKFLKEKNPNLITVAIEPAESNVLSGGEPGPHMIQGIGAGFIPDNLDKSLVDEVLTVKSQDALKMARQLAKKEGLLVGISSGANVFGAVEIGKRPENEGKTIVTFLCDFGERYLSTSLYE